MVGKLELLAQASHEAIEELLTIVGDDIPRYTILVDNVRPNEVNDILLFYFPHWNCLPSAYLEK